MNTLFLCLVLLIIIATTFVLYNIPENGFDPATTHPGSINVNANYFSGFDPAKISPAAI